MIERAARAAGGTAFTPSTTASGASADEERRLTRAPSASREDATRVTRSPAARVPPFRVSTVASNSTAAFMPVNPMAFVEELSRFEPGSDAERRAARRAFLVIDGLQRSGHFKVVDYVLTLTKTASLGASTVLSLLTVTLHAKALLKARGPFVERAEARLRECLGDTRAERLLVTRR